MKMLPDNHYIPFSTRPLNFSNIFRALYLICSDILNPPQTTNTRVFLDADGGTSRVKSSRSYAGTSAVEQASCIVTSSWTVTYFTPHDRSSAICTTPEDCSDVQGRRLWTSNSDTCATRTPRFLSIHRVIPRWCLLGRCVVVRGNRMIEACGTVRLERDHGITPVWLPVAI